MKEKLTLELMIELSDEEIFYLSKTLLDEYYADIYTDNDNYIFAVGSSPTCLVCHLDTRRSPSIPVSLIEHRGYLANLNGIMGADDRAGVYMVFNLLRECIYKKLPFPSILFTNHEEIGELGVREFINNKTLFNSRAKINLFMGLDRCGFNKCVIYKPLPKNYLEYFNLFDFEFINKNRRSDLSVISNSYNIPTVNISIGYYFEHTKMEVLNLEQYTDMFIKVLKMLKKPLRIEQ